MKIFLNPGHGGKDPGAVSKSGTKESDVCAKICEILALHLRRAMFVVEVFQEKTSLNEVIAQENKSGAALCVSVHCNSFTSDSANGVETLYFPTSAKGQKLASCIQKSLVSATKLTNRGIKARTDLGVLKYTKAPSVLVECAFISNPKEEAMLKTTPELFAGAILSGILKYCE